MASQLYLLTRARQYLLKKAVEGLYVRTTEAKYRGKGLGEFLTDLAQMEITTNPDPTYTPQQVQKNTGATIQLITPTLENIAALRPAHKTTTLNISGAAEGRYLQLLGKYPELHGEDRSIQHLVSNVLNALGCGLLVPTAWPDQLAILGPNLSQELLAVRQQLLEFADNELMTQALDISDTASYSVSDTAWNKLMSGEFHHNSDFKIWQIIEHLSKLEYVDTRNPDEMLSNTRDRWANSFLRKRTRTIRLSQETRMRFVEIAKKHNVYPFSSRLTDTAITSGVLEAIGLGFLTPVSTQSVNDIYHGPLLVTSPEMEY